MLDWILQNKDWIFSGIGVVIISAVTALLRSRKRRSETSDTDIENRITNMHPGPVFWEFHENGDLNKDRFDIFSHLPQARKLDILIFHRGGLFKQLRHKISQLLDNGLEIRLLYLKPGSETAMLLESRVEGKDVITSKIKALETEISQTETEIGKSDRNGSFRYVQYDWLPPASLIVLTFANNRKIVKVALNPIYPGECEDRGRICLVFDSLISSAESFYYADAFEYIWNKSEKAVSQTEQAETEKYNHEMNKIWQSDDKFFSGKIVSLLGGYGFIRPDDGGDNLFFYHRDADCDINDLNAGDSVIFQKGTNKKGPCAINVKQKSS